MDVGSIEPDKNCINENVIHSMYVFKKENDVFCDIDNEKYNLISDSDLSSSLETFDDTEYLNLF